MLCAVIVFPGSNCDSDAAAAIERVSGCRPVMCWHKDHELPAGIDCVWLPGGFSHGDYLRAGAMAARAPILKPIKEFAQAGGLVLGVCNGFQILTEAGLLPGALLRNASGRFVCREVRLKVENTNTPFTRAFSEPREAVMPVAHADGRYVASEAELDALEGEGRVVLRYVDNPNGSARSIAGILNRAGNVLGMMPHPERAADRAFGGLGGWPILQSFLAIA